MQDIGFYMFTTVYNFRFQKKQFYVFLYAEILKSQSSQKQTSKDKECT